MPHSAFIIRPFGVKNEIDFDRVEEQLVAPALSALGIEGSTTTEIVEQGNIREDMFQLLAVADLVIADISLHNANVFYELGVRHALQQKHTMLIRCESDEVPFDLKTDRYLVYDRDDPAKAQSALMDALRATLVSERSDSPVFQLLPGLKPQDRARLTVVPREFRESVTRAEKDGRDGDLELLREEASEHKFPWSVEGLRLVGDANYRRKSYVSAKETWESVLAIDSTDFEANMRLAEIYQKLGDLNWSDEALGRALDHRIEDRRQGAELYSLRATNLRTRWIKKWDHLTGEQAQIRALETPFLAKCLEAYSRAFEEDLNHYSSGLNALAMLTIQSHLAASHPASWADQFATLELPPGGPEAHHERLLAGLARRRNDLAVTVSRSLNAEKRRLRRRDETDARLRVALGEFACLQSTRPTRVARMYREALADATHDQLESMKAKLDVCERMGLRPDHVLAALSVVAERMQELESSSEVEDPRVKKVLVFTGHRVDDEDRSEPRFPRTKAAEQRAAEMIREAIQAELEGCEGEVAAYAGGASGSDILFHEACRALDVRTRLFLPGPKDEYLDAAVQNAGGEWVGRFNELHNSMCKEQRVRELGPSMSLPRWLQAEEDYSITQRSNLWILHNALKRQADEVVLIALWNKQQVEGSGGSEDMQQKARKRGAKVIVLDANELVVGHSDE